MIPERVMLTNLDLIVGDGDFGTNIALVLLSGTVSFSGSTFWSDCGNRQLGLFDSFL